VRRGATVEFLLTGGATLFLFSLASLLRHFVGLDDAELAAGFTTFYAAYIINDPHFTVTYFLFYKDERLHHYFMDHVVWRRENPETRWLTVEDEVLPVSIEGARHEA